MTSLGGTHPTSARQGCTAWGIRSRQARRSACASDHQKDWRTTCAPSPAAPLPAASLSPRVWRQVGRVCTHKRQVGTNEVGVCTHERDVVIKEVGVCTHEMQAVSPTVWVQTGGCMCKTQVVSPRIWMQVGVCTRYIQEAGRDSVQCSKLPNLFQVRMNKRGRGGGKRSAGGRGRFVGVLAWKGRLASLEHGRSDTMGSHSSLRALSGEAAVYTVDAEVTPWGLNQVAKLYRQWRRRRRLS